jgi:energy-coupling factor transport system ATP-binding protein
MQSPRIKPGRCWIQSPEPFSKLTPKIHAIHTHIHHASPDIAIHISNINYSLPATATTPPKQVLDDFTLYVPHGTLHMLLGLNGCGKSTILRLLAGLITPQSGSIYINSPTALVFQNPDHQVVMPTAAADAAFGLGRYSLPPAAAQALARASLDRVGLLHLADRPTSSMSGGQKQRLAIAGALAESPRVLLLDELTTFLDGEDQISVLNCVKDIVQNQSYRSDASSTSSSSSSNEDEEGGTSTSAAAASSAVTSTRTQLVSDRKVKTKRDKNMSSERTDGNPVTALWVTHRLEELDWADGVSYMHDGKVVFTGSPQEMRIYLKSIGCPV